MCCKLCLSVNIGFHNSIQSDHSLQLFVHTNTKPSVSFSAHLFIMQQSNLFYKTNCKLLSYITLSFEVETFTVDREMFASSSGISDGILTDFAEFI